MGMIEEYWGDVSIYSVEFSAQRDSNPARNFSKILVLPIGITKEDVFHLIPVYFSNIEEVLYVDELTDGLLLKQQ